MQKCAKFADADTKSRSEPFKFGLLLALPCLLRRKIL